MWKAISPFEATYIAAGGMATASDCTGNTVGSTRTITIGDVSFQEELVLTDDEKKAFAYKIVDCSVSPFPMTTYGAKCYVTEDGPDGCSVTWTGWYDLESDAKDEDAPDLVGLFSGLIAAAAEQAKSA